MGWLYFPSWLEHQPRSNFTSNSSPYSFKNLQRIVRRTARPMIEIPIGQKTSGRTPTARSVIPSYSPKGLPRAQTDNRFRRDEDGVALVEYGVLVGFIAVVCFAAVQLLGTQINAFF